MFDTILVGTDGSPTADRALDAAMELARSQPAVLHVVTAYRPLSQAEIADRRRGLQPARRHEIDEAAEARRILDDVRTRAAAVGINVELHARVGEPGAVVVDCAREVSADLVIVGNKGMKGVRRVLGSVPNHVAHSAQCSVLIVDTSDA
jgi:nucleotide-binding universal stress UspA family protein